MSSHIVPDSPEQRNIPLGYCQCGCGQKTSIAKRSDATKGWIKGEPVTYRRGHYTRGIPLQFERVDVDTSIAGYQDKPLMIISPQDEELARSRRWHTHHKGYILDGYGRAFHRLVTNCPPHLQVDHINGDRSDNRRSNLRIATSQENNRNRISRAGSTSKFVGVRMSKEGNWIASIGVNYKTIYLGTFDTEEAAAKARDTAAKDVFGEFAKINIP